MQVKLILNCPRAIAIACLSHKGQNSVQRKNSRSCCRVNRFAGKEQTSRRTEIAYYNSKQDTASSIHSKQFLTNKTLSNLILITCFAKLVTA